MVKNREKILQLIKENPTRNPTRKCKNPTRNPTRTWGSKMAPQDGGGEKEDELITRINQNNYQQSNKFIN